MQQGNKLCRRKKKDFSRRFYPLDKRCHWQKHFLLFDCDNVLVLMCRLETISCSNETRIYPTAIFLFFLFIKQSLDVCSWNCTNIIAIEVLL